MTQMFETALFQILDKLQDVVNQTELDVKIELPQVVVVGGQSSGKSSILEALMGWDCVPRGPEICTRRPLILELVRSNPQATNQTELEEYGEFLHIKGQKFTNFDKIKEEIRKETERVIGFDQSISSSAIGLRIYSPLVSTMTLIDLPGITHVPMGDPATDLDSLIKQMINSYIQPSNSIILAVTAANEDLTNSLAINIAKEVDPEGFRTIGVLTKLDLLDKDTNAVSLLRNEVVPLRLGYIAVINRSQDNSFNDIDIKTAQKNEESFFEHHLEYSEVIDHCGIDNLRRTLNKALESQIQRLLTNVRMKINVQIDQKRQELELYDDTTVLDTPLKQGALILSLISRYSQCFSAMIDGKTDAILLDLSGGAKIRDIFQTGFHKLLEDSNWRSDLTDEVIRTTIKNSTGVSGSLLIAQEPFELFVRQSIKTLLEPCIHIKELVEEELMKIAKDCIPQEVSRFSNLHKTVINCAFEFIRTSGSPAEEMIRNLIECEAESISYDHRDFLGGSDVIAEVLSERRAQAEDTSQDALLQEQGNLQNPAEDSISQEGEMKVRRRRRKSGRTRRGGLRPGNWLMNMFSKHDSDHDKKDLEVSLNSSSSLSLIPPMKRPLSPRPQDVAESFVESSQNHIELTVAITRKLVGSYMAIVQCNIKDLVPKIIRKFLVNDSKCGLQQYLITKLYKEDLFPTLIRENPEIAIKRNTCSEALKVLKTAMNELQFLVPNTFSC